ncbi:single-stranded DNA-binding protein [Candidatus Saccharibacteria bacterium]|nr:single-stranded DNA-binding protein [Candidatus Saccharibacteria bacterium]
MARGFSKAIICGNLTRDPELRATTSGTQVCSFSVAVNRVFKDASGANKESVSYIDCTAWGKTGETIAQYAKKGTAMLVSGRLDQRSWDDKATGAKRSRVEIVVEDFNFLGGGEGNGTGRGRAAAADNSMDGVDAEPEIVPDDIPADEEGEVKLDDIPF